MMSRLSQLIAEKQRIADLTDRAAADQLTELHGKTILQQTYHTWKKGRVPTVGYWKAMSAWLGLSDDEFRDLAEDAKEFASSSKVPTLQSFAYASPHGKISDRKEGKYRFEPYNRGRFRVPEGRYFMSIDTKVMEPLLRVGTYIWLDPAVPAKPGGEVVAHADGFGWLGILESWDAGGAVLSRPAGGQVTVKNAEAVHVVVLSSRTVG